MVNAAEAYKQQQLMNAPPEQLTLMLYNGCLRFIEDGIIAIKDKNFEDANTFALLLIWITKFRTNFFLCTITFMTGL